MGWGGEAFGRATELGLDGCLGAIKIMAIVCGDNQRVSHGRSLWSFLCHGYPVILLHNLQDQYVVVIEMVNIMVYLTTSSVVIVMEACVSS